ncbi:MAG: transposase [Selenomonadaceae bacterium]|nr:transposase [Selenomonadaceae bacterium]
MEKQESWQNRTLAPVDCLFVPIKRDYETKECAVYNILGIRVDGRKEILGLWIQDRESKHAWMQLFDELKARGVQKVGFISIDGGLGKGSTGNFP